MRILVTFAVEAEFAPWRKRHDFQSKEIRISGFAKTIPAFHTGVSGVSVDVLLTGIGWNGKSHTLSAKALQEMMLNDPKVCISTGLAGGLARNLSIGDVVAAGEIASRQGGNLLFCDPMLVAGALKCGAKMGKKLITENHVIGKASAKLLLANFGDFVDMESYHILSRVAGKGIPAIAVRAISDVAREDLPVDFNKVVSREGRIKATALANEILRRPRQIPALIKFGQNSRRAALQLANFLDQFIPFLAVHGVDANHCSVKQVAAQ